MRLRCQLLFLIAGVLAGSALAAAERLPPAPPRYFNDYTETVSAPTVEQLNSRLEQYERESSNQLLVAIYRHMDSDSSIEDYTVRVAQAWKVGQQGKNNGAVLFVFKDDHKLFIQVGYGLEATLTDARAHEIVENILKPRFRQGNFEAGLREAVSAMIAATKGEYHGTGRTHATASRSPGLPGGSFLPIFVFLVLFVLTTALRFFRRGIVYTGRRRGGSSIFWMGGGGWGGGGSTWSGGGDGGGGGGFSGGGGSFGGGGAGGSW